MAFLLLLILLFIFTLQNGENKIAFFILIMIIASIFSTYNKTFKESLKDFF